MYSFPDLEPVCFSMSGSNCCFLTWIQISQKAGKGSAILFSFYFILYIFIYLIIIIIFFLLYNIVLGLPNIEMNPPQVYMCFPSWTLLPPHTIPLDHPSVPAPSIQYCASNLDCWLVSYMILYVFQCHSPKLSQPLILPQRPKHYSIHQCLFCCLIYRVIVIIFLNSIYMR